MHAGRTKRIGSKRHSCSEIRKFLWMSETVGFFAQRLAQVAPANSVKGQHSVLVQACQQLTHGTATQISLALLGQDSALHCFKLHGSGPSGTLPVRGTAAGAALTAQRVISTESLSTRFGLLDWRQLASDSKSALWVPIVMNGVPLGTLIVASSQATAFQGLQQTFAALAATYAPHLKLTRSEKALNHTQQLLQQALQLEHASIGQQQQGAGDAVAAADSMDSTVTGAATPAALLQRRPAAITEGSDEITSDVAQPLDGSIAGSDNLPSPAATISTAAAPPVLQLAVQVVSVAKQACRFVQRRVESAVASNVRPAEAIAALAPLVSAVASKPRKLGKAHSRRIRSDGYSFVDYDLSSDDDEADPAYADALPALAAPLARWRGPLEFWDSRSEGRYMAAAAEWQAPLDLAGGSLALGRIMMHAASGTLADAGWVVAALRLMLALLLLAGCQLMLLRRSAYVRHRELLVIGVRIISMMILAASVQSVADGASFDKMVLSAPLAGLAPFIAQVRFSRHLPLEALHAAITVATVAASSAIGGPSTAMQLAATTALPTAGLFLLEHTTRRFFCAAS